jgi:urease accessory protein
VHLITSKLLEVSPGLTEISLRVDRIRLAKRRWRHVAEDGVEFGFELDAPLRDGDVFWQTAAHRYVIRQDPEPVLVVDMELLAAPAAAGIGWAVGNLHLDLMADSKRLVTPDDKPARQLFERIHIAYTEERLVFRPGRFVRGGVNAGAQEMGRSHQH